MEFRLAKPKDLSEIQTVYHLIEHMSESNIVLWDKEPPNGVLADDIEAGRLIVHSDEGRASGR